MILSSRTKKENPAAAIIAVVIVLVVFAIIILPMLFRTKNRLSGRPVMTDVYESIISFGYYPQKEVKGDSLTDDIINANYVRGIATVDGFKYCRINAENVVYNHFAESGEISEHYYDWSSEDYRYFVFETILWRVVTIDGDKVFCLAENILDCVPYNFEVETQVTWDNSYVNAFLNGKTGLGVNNIGIVKEAFSSDDLKNLYKITTDDNGRIVTTEGLGQYMFLVSMEDDYLLSTVEKDVPDFGYSAASDFAMARGIYGERIPYTHENSGNAWLRDGAGALNSFQYADVEGVVNPIGTWANEKRFGVRPMIVISKEAISVNPDLEEQTRIKDMERRRQEPAQFLDELSVVKNSEYGQVVVKTCYDSKGVRRICATSLVQVDPEEPDETIPEEERVPYYILNCGLEYKRLKGTISYGMCEGATRPVVVRFFADGKEIYQSGILSKDMQPVEADIDLRGVRNLKIQWSAVDERTEGMPYGVAVLSDFRLE